MYSFYNFCVLKVVEIQHEFCLIKLRILLTSFLWPRWTFWKYNKANFFRIYLSSSLITDWCIASSKEKPRKNSQWKDLVESMLANFKSTGNITLKNFHFQSNIKKYHETFIAFCNPALLEAKHCNVHHYCTSTNYAEWTAVQDPTINELKSNDIQQ